MRIGIVTYIKDDNYGEELQAYAMQHYLNKKGYDAEVIDLEKRVKHLQASKDAIVPAIMNRFKVYGWKAPYMIVKKVIDEINRKKEYDPEYMARFHKLFTDFFDKYTVHSKKYYTLDEIRVTNDLPYDTYIAGSDQIWNYMHTDFLDVFFLEFAKKFNARRISYAASISVPRIPKDMMSEYARLVENIEYLSVRETLGAELLKECFEKDAEVVVDPTFLLDKDEWMSTVGINPYEGQKYVLVYTLSRSKYISKLARSIAQDLGCCKVILIVGSKTYVEENGNLNQIMVSPSEWVGLMAGAAYVVTDSFHGTAFSINFNRPFTTLMNPASNMNTRVMSVLAKTGLTNRIICDDGKNKLPDTLSVDFTPVNAILEAWKTSSVNFITAALK